MVRLVFICVLCGVSFLLFPNEKKEERLTSILKLTGIWVTEDSVRMELLEDGTCRVNRLDLSKFTSLDSVTKKVDMRGEWDYDFFFNRFPVDHSNYRKLLVVIREPESGKEYSLAFSIKKHRKLFGDREPWELYVPDREYYGKNAYEFRQKLKT